MNQTFLFGVSTNFNNPKFNNFVNKLLGFVKYFLPFTHYKFFKLERHQFLNRVVINYFQGFTSKEKKSE